MVSFTMEIAGLTVCVQPMFESTKEYCRPYLTEKEPELTVRVTEDDCVVEQMLLDQEAEEEGLKKRVFTGPFLERTAIQRRVADALLERDTLMLHGSTVAVDGKAYLFTAPCGTGKSTHTRLWREVFGARAIMVNDDKPFLQLTEDCVYACGSPWSGKHGLASNVRIPLKGICSLMRGKENVISRVDSDRLIDLLRHQAFAPLDADLLQKTHILVERLANRVPLWEMSCNKESEAAKVAYSFMNCDGL